MNKKFFIPVFTSLGVLVAGVTWLLIYADRSTPIIGFDGPAGGLLGLSLLAGGLISGTYTLVFLKNKKGSSLFKNLVWFVVSLFVACLCVGVVIGRYASGKYPDAAEAVTSWATYHNAKQKFSLTYPSGWDVLEADGSGGVNVDDVWKATIFHPIQNPQDSTGVSLDYIALPLDDVVTYRREIYSRDSFYENAGIVNGSTTYTEFTFKGHRAIRIDTTGKTLIPEGAEYNLNFEQHKVNMTEIFIAANGVTYNFKASGEIKFDDHPIYRKIYDSITFDQ